MYEYREVKCPKCRHVFMWNTSAHDGFYYYKKHTKDHIGNRSKCPSCGEVFAVLKNKFEGMFEDNLPDDILIGRDIYYVPLGEMKT